MTPASPPTLHPQTRGAWARAVALHRARLSDDCVLLLPDGYDPDGYVRAFGIEALCALIGQGKPPPYTKKERARTKYERTWDAIEAKIASTPGSSLWWEEASAAHEKEQRERAEKERQERELQAIRDRLGARHRGAGAETRARAYVATMDACSSADAAAAARVLVRGFALPEDVALTIFREDFIPRLQRKGKTTKRDIIGWIQRAGRSHLPLGYLLERKR